MGKPILSTLAMRDLVNIENYIIEELKNPTAAHRIVKLITKRIRSLAIHPLLGPVLCSMDNGSIEYRRLLCDNYCVYYRFDGDAILVIRILHNLQDYERILFGSLN